jgi:hypothetical protein
VDWCEVYIDDAAISGNEQTVERLAHWRAHR